MFRFLITFLIAVAMIIFLAVMLGTWIVDTVMMH